MQVILLLLFFIQMVMSTTAYANSGSLNITPLYKPDHQLERQLKLLNRDILSMILTKNKSNTTNLTLQYRKTENSKDPNKYHDDSQDESLFMNSSFKYRTIYRNKERSKVFLISTLGSISFALMGALWEIL